MADCGEYGFSEVDNCEESRSTSWSVVDESSPCSTPPECGAPISRQFWKAGTYNNNSTHVSKTYVGSSYLHIHPKFLHSNATSHKWAFGAIAELLDNAVDEIQNGATYVMIDKIPNPRNGSPALLIQDNGAGMDPKAMSACLSFGFSDKKSESSIGKYGNGFKTSSMRLGADAIVFTRNFVDQTFTQSIGLLSYTFLTQSGYDRIVVPMVHYKCNLSTGSFEPLQTKSDRHPNLNLSVLLKWSPYSTEEELLKQFDDVGLHGTKIIIYNLWLNDDGNMELDFESDPEDIRLSLDKETKAKDGSKQAITDNHLANRLQYSVSAYLSILYLKLPPNFCIALRGKVVQYHNTAADLKHPEFILYKPHKGKSKEGVSVVTAIGFLKEAPHVKVHGFNIYHKKRLILPYLPVVSSSCGKGRGVVGVLEANFMEPTHSKQDFEKTTIFQKLVTRLRDMTLEYWDVHCRLLGYTNPKKARCSYASRSCPKEGPTSKRKLSDQPEDSSSKGVNGSNSKRKLPNQPEDSSSEEANGSNLKRRSHDHHEEFLSDNVTIRDGERNTVIRDPKKKLVMQQNKKLKEDCMKFEKREKELNLKVMNLKTVLEEAENEYAALLTELQRLENMNM